MEETFSQVLLLQRKKLMADEKVTWEHLSATTIMQQHTSIRELLSLVQSMHQSQLRYTGYLETRVEVLELRQANLVAELQDARLRREEKVK